MAPEELLLEDELLELLDEGLLLPVELLELEELELEDGFTSLGFDEPPLPQAASDVAISAKVKDLAKVDLKCVISPPGYYA